jgi:hypothetical protein
MLFSEFSTAGRFPNATVESFSGCSVVAFDANLAGNQIEASLFHLIINHRKDARALNAMLKCMEF